MTDLSPDLGARLGRLLPRLASDAPGEVVATVSAIRRTLDRAGLDLHDLAARLTEAPRPVLQRISPTGTKTDLLALAQWLQTHARGRLTSRQAEFLNNATRLLGSGRQLTLKQANWLRDLHAMHANTKGH